MDRPQFIYSLSFGEHLSYLAVFDLDYLRATLRPSFEKIGKSPPYAHTSSIGQLKFF
jgi:hypothetical protein